MIEFIVSKDYREYLEGKQIKLSDWDKAALIYNHIFLSHNDKKNALAELMKSTQDVRLKKQIAERLDRDAMYYQAFKENTGNAFYVLSVQEKNVYTDEDPYLTFEDAYNEGIEKECAFRIQKYLFKCKENEGDTEGVFGIVSYEQGGVQGNLFALYQITKNDCLTQADNTRFEERYLNLPLMFRKKDIVHVIGTEWYGIVDGPANDSEEEKYTDLAKKGDYSDYQVPVNLIFNGQKFLSIFSHDHYHPTELEYARFEENDTRKGFLDYMVKTIYQSSWFSGTVRDAGRMKEILSQLEQVWRQYPNMRFGQLILNLIGRANLFTMEDEQLLEKIQANIFPIEE